MSVLPNRAAGIANRVKATTSTAAAMQYEPAPSPQAAPVGSDAVNRMVCGANDSGARSE
jgi:hypothetical protein